MPARNYRLEQDASGIPMSASRSTKLSKDVMRRCVTNSLVTSPIRIPKLVRDTDNTFVVGLLAQGYAPA